MTEQIAFRPKRKNSKKTACCALSGSLDISKVKATQVVFKEALATYANLEITFESVEDIDLGFFQLLYSLKKSADGSSKSVSFKGELPHEAFNLFSHAGIDLNKEFELR